MARPVSFRLSAVDRQRIADSVTSAERHTSAEIKVVIKRHGWSDLRSHACRVFHKHGLHRTAQRNAVMILVVLTNREFLIYGDSGIDEKVPEGFWNRVRDSMLVRLHQGCLAEGICAAVDEVAGQLAFHFPRQPDDVDEIPDEVGDEP